MTYQAIVGRIKTQPHPNADRLKLGNIYGNQVVVGLDTKDDDLMLYFPADGQLSKEFAEAHDLVRRKDPTTGKDVGGFFDENRRVRNQTFRGVKSEGYAVPLNYLDFTHGDTHSLNIGDQLDTFNGVPICNKYETAATKLLRATRQQAPKVRLAEVPLFREHFDTKQWRYYSETIPEGALITITEKLHGTSQRFANLPVLRRTPAPWYRRLFGQKYIEKWNQEHVLGTRRVALINGKADSFYSEDGGFRASVVAGLQLRPGETLYFEVVGFTESNAPIMSSQKVTDKALKKVYGDLMTYSYGLHVGCEMYVYRITHTDSNGHVVELPWYQVVSRCAELGVKPVPVLCQFIHRTTTETNLIVESLTSDGVASILDQRHIREGVAVRVEHPSMFGIYKHKTFTFGVLEGYLKDTGVADLEESA